MKAAKAKERLHHALKLLERARDDGATGGDLDGDEPLLWAYAVGAAKFTIEMALYDLGDKSVDPFRVTKSANQPE